MPILNKKDKKKSPVPKSQATFNRQLRKISQLKEELRLFKEECDQALALYHSSLKPKEKEAGHLITRFLFKVTDLTQEPKALNKKERTILKEVIEASLDSVFSLLPYGEIDEKLKELYQNIHGINFEKEFQKEISKLKEMFKEHPEADHVDFSTFNPEDSPQEILEKLAESFKTAREKDENSSSFQQKIQKKSLKEKHAQDLEELKNKGLSTIYKRLAKKLHPDLEQDEEKRSEKDALMKRLSLAYKNQDLVSLLAIQSEFAEEESPQSSDEETMKIYNSILKDQIEELKQEFAMISFHARYVDLHRYIENNPENPLEEIRVAMTEVDSLIEEYALRLKDLSGNNPLKTLKQALASLEKQFSEEEISEEEILDYLLNSFLDEMIFSNPPKRGKKRNKK